MVPLALAVSSKGLASFMAKLHDYIIAFLKKCYNIIPPAITNKCPAASSADGMIAYGYFCSVKVWIYYASPSHLPIFSAAIAILYR
jgi:hypothetical protein